MFEERLRKIVLRLELWEDAWFNPPATLSQVGEVEQRIGFSLPEDYREFILLLGDGGVGPAHYGINALHDENRPKNEELERPQFTIHPPLTNENISDDNFRDWDELSFHQRMEEQCFLWLGTDGCAMWYLLGITGPERGFMWFFEDCAAKPLIQAMDGGRVSFLDWYEQWSEKFLQL